MEDAGLVVLAACLFTLAFAQILLRNLLGVALPWADPLVRHLVLWTSLVGALLAARQGRHIRIDALLRILPPRGRRIAQAAGDLGAAVVCLLLCGLALRFVLDERAYGDIAFLGTPRWVLEVIFPVAFGGMGVRFALGLVPGRRRHAA